MSETETKPAASSKTPSFLGISVGTIFTALISLLGSALGSGPWGIAVLGVLGISGTFGYRYMMHWWNKKVDASDQENAGADAGTTAADIANQAGKINSDLDDLQNLNPPSPPTL